MNYFNSVREGIEEATEDHQTKVDNLYSRQLLAWKIRAK